MTEYLLPPGNQSAPVLRLKQVTKIYDDSVQPLTALNNVSACFYPGEFVSIIGKSGCGKTTLVNMITGIDQITAGEVWYGDVNLHKLNQSQMASWRGRNIGIVYQFFQLLPNISLLDNILLPMDFCNIYQARLSPQRAMDLLDSVGLADHARKLPSAISGGQQQRVAIARALANDPPILIADEPTGSLDSLTAASIFDIFAQLAHQGKTVLVVTHDSALANRSTRTVLMSNGEIVNEYVAHTFPELSAEQMLKISNSLQHRTFQPGTTIITQGKVTDGFYILCKGRVEIVLKGTDGNEIVAAHLAAPQYFGEIELLNGGQAIASVRAAGDREVELICLERSAFQTILQESEPSREKITRVADQRNAQNETSRRSP